MPQPSQAFSETNAALCAFLILLVPFTWAGLALMNTGLGRSRSAAHSMLTSISVVAVAALAYFVCGFAWQGYVDLPAHSLWLGGKGWSWAGAQPLFLRHVEFNGSPASFAAWLGMFSVGLAAMIPLGAGADRWRLGACCASTALLAGIIYPLFAHWIWGGGWLAQLGVNYGLGHGFVDAGGASSIQVVGGLAALTMAWILGPRRGKYSHEGMPSAIPGHNPVFVLFGCLVALVGWLGLNGAGTILFTGAAPERVGLAAVNTMLSAASSALAAVVVTRIRFGKPDASLSANGWTGGLVASSAACAFVTPAEAVLIGLAAGALVTLSVEWFELHLKIDDPGGAISVHAVGGLWGVLGLGLFARFPTVVFNVARRELAVGPLSDSGQMMAQLVGVATLLGFILPLIYGLNVILNRIYPHRATLEGERQGMDLHELGAGAYPEFVTHTDEFMPR